MREKNILDWKDMAVILYWGNKDAKYKWKHNQKKHLADKFEERCVREVITTNDVVDIVYPISEFLEILILNTFQLV